MSNVISGHFLFYLFRNFLCFSIVHLAVDLANICPQLTEILDHLV